MKKVYNDDSISEYKGIYQAAVASLQQDSLTKNSIKIQDDFYFSSFHPINDYSLQVYIIRQKIKEKLFYKSMTFNILIFMIFIDNLLRITTVD